MSKAVASTEMYSLGVQNISYTRIIANLQCFMVICMACWVKKLIMDLRYCDVILSTSYYEIEGKQVVNYGLIYVIGSVK